MIENNLQVRGERLIKAKATVRESNDDTINILKVNMRFRNGGLLSEPAMSDIIIIPKVTIIMCVAQWWRQLYQHSSTVHDTTKPIV